MPLYSVFLPAYIFVVATAKLVALINDLVVPLLLVSILEKVTRRNEI